MPQDNRDYIIAKLGSIGLKFSKVGVSEIAIVRPGQPDLLISVTSASWLDAEEVNRAVDRNPAIDAVVNMGYQSHYSAEAKRAAARFGIEVYSFRELCGAINQDPFKGYEWGAVSHVKHTLPTHSRVVSVENICEQELLIRRTGKLSPIRFVVATIYTLGQVDVRKILQYHPDTQAILNLGGYNQYSSAAKSLATNSGVGLFTYGELMGALNFEGRRFLSYQAD
jgi:hypothetical protein